MMRIFAPLALGFLMISIGAVAQQAVDLVIWGGPIYTGDETEPTVEALAIDNGRIILTGSRRQIEARVGPDTRVIDLDGATALPGLVDAHAHLRGIGERELTLNLEGLKSLQAVLDAVAARVAAAGPGEVISGRGWIETFWPEGRFPSRYDLDRVAPDNPVILTRADGHAIVANSAALEQAGINRQTQAPYGGEILVNGLGQPTGMLIDKAMALVAEIAARAVQPSAQEAYVTAARVSAAYGWTGIHNMSVPPQDVSLIEQLAQAGDMTIRVYNAIDPEGADALIAGGARSAANDRVITRTVKLYMDGALGSRGAALLAPYADADTSGLLLMREDQAMPLLRAALRGGIQIAGHAIGDRGNRLMLDWFERVYADQPDRSVDARWRVEHAQIVNPDDLARFEQIGIIPSMQPSHAIGDLHFAPDRLGDERLVGAYAWQSLINSGSIIAGGSDAPVERGDPMIEFYAAVARRDLEGFQGESWHPEEAVSRTDALKMFTIWPAIASFQEDELGTLVAGKKADITVLDRDIMRVDIQQIPQTRAVMTIVDGRIIFDAIFNAAP